MKKHIQILLATILLGLVLSVVPVQAQGPRLISDIREDFNGLLLQLRVFDNSCVIITGGLLDELRALILDGRKLVTVGKGNLSPALIALVVRTQFQIATIVLQVAIYCGGDEIRGPSSVNSIPQAKGFTPLVPSIGFGGIFFIGNQINALKAEIAAIDTLDERKSNKIGALLTDALAHVNGILNLSDNILNEGGCIFDLTRAINPIINNETTQAVPQLTETGPISFEDLREIKVALGLAANAVKDCLHTLREITKEKKWLFKDIREVKELLRASNFGGRAASDLSLLTEGAIKVYTLNGTLVTTQSNGLDVNRLANGVYLAIAGNKIRRVAVNR